MRIAGRAMSGLRVFLAAIRLALNEFLRDFCHQRAAALAFTSIFAIVPLTAIFIFVLNITGFFTEYRERAQDLILRHFAPESREAVERFISDLIGKLSDYSTSSGLLGFATFVAVGILLLITIEGVFNDIWKVRKSRPLMKRVFAFWFVLCFIPISLASSAYIKTRVEGIPVVRQIISNTTIEGIVYEWVLPALLSYLSFLILYVFLPNTRVGYLWGLSGALLAGTLWELAKAGFKVYLSHSVSFYQLFGSLAAIPIFFLWVYVSWVIVLFGAEFTYTLQHLDYVRLAGRSRHPCAFIPVDDLCVLLAADIASRFDKGKSPPSVEDLSIRFGLPPLTLLNLLEQLERAGIIHSVSDGERFVVARPPESIKLMEIFKAARDGACPLPANGPSEMARVRSVLDSIREESHRTHEETSLKDLLA